MRSTKIFFVLAALLAVGTTAIAVAAHAERRMVPVSDTVKEMLADLDAATQRELSTGCVEEDGHGERRLCGDSRTRIDAMHDEAIRAADDADARPADARKKATDAIRRFRKNDRLAVAYRSTSPNPYKDGDQRIEIYADDNGFEYWVDPADDGLVQIGPGAGLHQATRKTRPEARLPVAELRSRAHGIIEAQMPGFASRRSSYHPLEDHKDKEIYFFRWDDFSQPAKESEMPPFVQVGLRADGELASFTNTLNR